jgi:2,3-bisphosphoglycerate-independent phosphoglycerate mutase
MKNKHVILVILDGWGKGTVPKADAIRAAKTPFVDSFYNEYPNSELVTFGEEVGLPEGQMGNSEVGHLNIGAGRVVYQELARINKACRDGELAENAKLKSAFQYAKENNKAVHLMGLVSDGGVHSHINHLKTLCDISQGFELEKVFIHAFMDGRDTDPKGGKNYLKDVLNHIENQNVDVASVIGRYYAMDRDKRWERVKLAYDLLVNGEGEKTSDVLVTLQERYEKGETDEFLKPIVCQDENGNPKTTIQSDDVVLFFNFRTDRPRQLTTVLTQQDMPDFGMSKLNLRYLTMTKYDETFKGMEVLFEKEDIKNTLGEILSKNGLTQTRIAETEKYPHVTFFFNGGREQEFEGEKRILISSPKIATYDLKPEMSAYEVTEAIIEDIEQNQPNFICLNYANADMVGHTGDFEAAIKAAETVDVCLKNLIETALKFDYEAIIIADHGNSDYMINEDGSPNTAHTTNLVPCFYVSKQAKGKKIKNGKLGDIAPTILSLMEIEPPTDMNGNNLIE